MVSNNITYNAMRVFLLVFLLSMPKLSLAYDSGLLKASAKKNKNFCTINYSHISRNTPFSTHIEMKGTDGASYTPNTFRLKNKLWSLNLEAIRTGQVKKLKGFVINLAEEKSFTKIKPFKPLTFHGKKPNWLSSYPPFQEGQFEIGMMLHVMSQSYAILKPHLSAEEEKVIFDWADASIMELNSKPRPKGSYDIKASMAAGLITWGLVSGRKDALRKGKSLYQEVIRATDRKGRIKVFIDPNIFYGKELRYLHMTNGYLAIAAWALDKSGDRSIRSDIKKPGNLVDGINFTTLAILDSGFRDGISEQQIEVDEMRSQVSSTYWQSFAYLEYMSALGVTEKDLPALKYTNRIKQRRGGYYSGFHGGYTSCLVY